MHNKNHNVRSPWAELITRVKKNLKKKKEGKRKPHTQIKTNISVRSQQKQQQTDAYVNKPNGKRNAQSKLSLLPALSLCYSLLMVGLVLYICQLENFFILCFSTRENILTHTHKHRNLHLLLRQAAAATSTVFASFISTLRHTHKHA